MRRGQAIWRGLEIAEGQGGFSPAPIGKTRTGLRIQEAVRSLAEVVGRGDHLKAVGGMGHSDKC